MKADIARSAVAFLLGIVLLVAPAASTQGAGSLDIYWIDVEGGAATLLVTPLGESILIDTGNPGRRDPDRIVQVATKVAGLRQIDHLVVTHYHRDHYGGAAMLATMLPIKRVYDNGIFEGMPDHPGKAYFSFKCDERIVIQPGEAIPLRKNDQADHNCRIVCLAARKQFIKPGSDARKNEEIVRLHRPKDRDGSDNANSVALLVEFGPFQFFDAGDLTWNQELNLVHPYDLVGTVDVYQVTHHGLSSSNNPVVLKTIQPTVAIMNNGHQKGCAPEVFATLQETTSLQSIYQVHKNLREDGAKNNVADKFIANFETAENCKGHFIKLSVEPSGNHYTVSIPAHGHQQKFKTE